MDELFVYSIVCILMGVAMLTIAAKSKIEGNDVLLLKYRGPIFGILFIVCGLVFLWRGLAKYM